MQHGLHQVHCGLGLVQQLFYLEIYLAFLIRLQYDLVVISSKGLLPAEQQVHEHADREHIALVVIKRQVIFIG